MNEFTRPDFDSIALLTIDVQRDFISMTSPGASEKLAVIPGVCALTDAFRHRNKPIIHVVRIYKEDGSNADLCRRADIMAGSGLLKPGSDGVQIVKEILPDPDIRLDDGLLLKGGVQELGDDEFVIYKPRFGAFYGTKLSSLLDSLGVGSLAFCGFNFPNCPRTSIYEASERDYRITVPEDGISHIYTRGIDELKAIGIVMTTTKELAGDIAGRPA